MKALTIWQPWASLIMIGAKPYEFRRWAAYPRLIGETIVIHAAARPVNRDEVEMLIVDLEFGVPMNDEVARPFLRRVMAGERLPIAAGLGTAVLGRPVKCTELYPDDPEVDPQKWAWPLTDITQFRRPIPARGAQGFWDWPEAGKQP